jgi:hypothetical protein
MMTMVTLPPQEWVHVAVARDDEGATHLYVNGELEASKMPSRQIEYGNSDISFGADYRDQRLSLIGRLRDIRLYSVALDALDVRQLVFGSAALIRPANKLG